MPEITQHQSNAITKVIYIGDSTAGKTGSLASLCADGYNLRVIDLDNGLDVLRDYLTNPASRYVKARPDAAKHLRYVTLTDKHRNLNGVIVPAQATVWQRAISLLIHWKEPDGTDLGRISEWSPNEILVIDSLSMLATAALNFHLSMNGALGKSRTQNEGRRDVGSAQNLIRDFLNLIFDESLKCNVILIAHITMVNEVGGHTAEDKAHDLQGYPAAIGRALSPHIPRYFNNMLIAKIAGGIGAQVQRKIYTTPQIINGSVVGAKSTAPLRVLPEYPLETGLADYFRAVRGGQSPESKV